MKKIIVTENNFTLSIIEYKVNYFIYSKNVLCVDGVFITYRNNNKIDVIEVE